MRPAFAFLAGHVVGVLTTTSWDGFIFMLTALGVMLVMLRAMEA